MPSADSDGLRSRSAARSPGSGATDAAQPGDPSQTGRVGDAASSEGAYDGFRRGLYLFAVLFALGQLGILWVLLEHYGVPDTFVPVEQTLLKAGVVSGLAALFGRLAAWRSRFVWVLTMIGVTAALVGVLMNVGIPTFGPVGTGAGLVTIFPEDKLLGSFYLLYSLVLGAVLYMGWTGRKVLGTPRTPPTGTSRKTEAMSGQATSSSSHSFQPTGSTASQTVASNVGPDPGPSGVNADRGMVNSGDPPTNGWADGEESAVQSTGMVEDAADGPVDWSGTVTAESEADSAATAGERAGKTDVIEDTPATGPDAVDEGDQSSGTADPGEAGEEETAGGASDEPVPGGTTLDPNSASPEDVRALCDPASSTDLSAETLATLESLAQADDEAIRVAVCEVCAGSGDDRAASILRSLRIDPSDDVSAAAIEGLSSD